MDKLWSYKLLKLACKCILVVVTEDNVKGFFKLDLQNICVLTLARKCILCDKITLSQVNGNAYCLLQIRIFRETAM